jgi:hypothetical protein
LAFIALRLTFGGAANPSLFSDFSETITDLANSISACPEWNPVDLHSEHCPLVGPLKYEGDSVPLAAERPTIVDVYSDIYGCSECFIDDTFTAQPDVEGVTPDRGAQAVQLAIEALGCPLSEGDTLPRDFLLAVEKAIAEGTLSELLVVLGWLLDTRRWLVLLPPDKHKAWTEDVRKLIESPGRRVPHKELESLVSRLQHVASLLTTANPLHEPHPRRSNTDENPCRNAIDGGRN